MNKKIIIVACTILISIALGYVGIQKYLSKQNDIALLENQQNEKNDNVIIQKVEAGSTCASNAHCKSGNCQIGVCEPCSDSFCDNDGQCCDEYTKGCINTICSNGDNGYPCNSNEDCNNHNCYGGFCIDCLKKAMLCTNDGQCCSPMSCLDGACFECLPHARACNSNGECCSGVCVNGSCSCRDDGCICTSGDTCKSSNCYAGLCQHRSINRKVGAAYAAGGIAVTAGIKSYLSNTASEYAQKVYDDAYDGDFTKGDVEESFKNTGDPLPESKPSGKVFDQLESVDEDSVEQLSAYEDNLTATLQDQLEPMEGYVKEGVDDMVDTAQLAGEDAATQATTLGATTEVAADVDTAVTATTLTGEIAAK